VASASGKVALTSSSTACVTTCIGNLSLIDFVGYGTANEFEGTTGPAPLLDSTHADFRQNSGNQDTDDNAADFASGPPLPRNSSSPPTGDHVAPVSTLNAIATLQKKLSFNVGWSATDDFGVASYDARERHAGPTGAFTGYSSWYSGTSTSALYAAAVGQTVCISVRAADISANAGAYTADKCTGIPIDDSALTAQKFTRKSNAAYFNGTYSLSVVMGAKLTSTTITGKRLAILATTCAACGSIQFKWKGAVIGTFSLYSATTKHNVIVPVTVLTAAESGIAQIVTLSTARVEIDGVYASRK